MIRIATPALASEMNLDSKPLSFDRLRYGMIGPAAGIVYRRRLLLKPARSPRRRRRPTATNLPDR